MRYAPHPLLHISRTFGQLLINLARLWLSSSSFWSTSCIVHKHVWEWILWFEYLVALLLLFITTRRDGAELLLDVIQQTAVCWKVEDENRRRRYRCWRLIFSTTTAAFHSCYVTINRGEILRETPPSRHNQSEWVRKKRLAHLHSFSLSPTHSTISAFLVIPNRSIKHIDLNLSACFTRILLLQVRINDDDNIIVVVLSVCVCVCCRLTQYLCVCVTTCVCN